jgi:SAM-dependent methyltransferase
MEYTATYENALDFSPRFQSFAKDLASYLIEVYDIRNKTVIDIGSGKGEFLKLISSMGENRGIGFDPSYISSEGEEEDDDLTFFTEFFSEKHSSYKADLICCRHVLEHVHNPREFISMIRQGVGNDRETILYFEVPDAHFTFCELGIWDLIYEHPSYFNAASLAYLFESSGFRTIEINSRFGGQFLSIEASPRFEGLDMSEVTSINSEIVSCVAEFPTQITTMLKWWNNKLTEISELGERVVLWGAGSKGVTFLNLMRGVYGIDYVVDINPRKQGMYIAGTGQEIIDPGRLRDIKPDVLIIMNPIYEDEIRETMGSLDLDPRILTAISR